MVQHNNTNTTVLYVYHIIKKIPTTLNKPWYRVIKKIGKQYYLLSNIEDTCSTAPFSEAYCWDAMWWGNRGDSDWFTDRNYQSRILLQLRRHIRTDRQPNFGRTICLVVCNIIHNVYYVLKREQGLNDKYIRTERMTWTQQKSTSYLTFND